MTGLVFALFFKVGKICGPERQNCRTRFQGGGGWVGWGGGKRNSPGGIRNSRPARAILAKARKKSRTDVEPVRLSFFKLFLAFSPGVDRARTQAALRAAKGAQMATFDHLARVGAGEAPGAGLTFSRTVVSFLDKTLSKTP